MGMEVPEVFFADSGGVSIAWQRFGSGLDVVAIPPLISNMEIVWESTHFRRFLEHMAGHVRITAFDKRGIGLSDKFTAIPTLEQRVDDIAAVMDAAGLERAALLGHSEGGLLAAVFAAMYPERVSRLVIVNAFPSASWRTAFLRASLDPATIVARREALVELMFKTWGTDPRPFLRIFAPSLADDVVFVRWMARFQRQSGTPNDIRRQMESLVALDAVPYLTDIRAPTLVIHVIGDQVCPVGASRDLAGGIAGARLMEVEGDDHLAEVTPLWRTIVDAWLEFVTGRRVDPPAPSDDGRANGWDSFTATESKVVDLIQLGLTNRDIGVRLGSSARTVETHLAHVFQKLGISSRVELAAIAARRS